VNRYKKAAIKIIFSDCAKGMNYFSQKNIINLIFAKKQEVA
jgi:hypothetical protein